MDLNATPFADPHRRYDPLTGRWVLVSAGRTNRPWQGREEQPAPPDRPTHDPSCYLCPGATRAGGQRNPDYERTFVFTNDFAALRPGSDPELAEPHPLLRSQRQPGTCRVICFSPRHDLTLARMTLAELETVVELWVAQFAELAPHHRWVQVFENRGEAMGASNPHPHGQIWASQALPREPELEDRHQRDHLAAHGSPLLADYVEIELEQQERLVAVNDGWVALVPFWAVWPFETLVLPRQPVQRLTDLTSAMRAQLSDLLQELLVRYDNLFAHPFPYSMGWHGAPGWDRDEPAWVLHAHFYPPLLRSATVRKWMVGYEMLADVQRDLTAEGAAERLRAVSSTHHHPRAD